MVKKPNLDRNYLVDIAIKEACQARLKSMSKETKYAKLRRECEKAIILYQVNGKVDEKYIDSG